MPKEAEAPPYAGQAVALMEEFQAALVETHGYRKIRVDTWISPDATIAARVGYAGSEWRVNIRHQTHANLVFFTVKFDLSHPLPTVEQLLKATVLRDKPPAAKDMDANHELMLRGAE